MTSYDTDRVLNLTIMLKYAILKLTILLSWVKIKLTILSYRLIKYEEYAEKGIRRFPFECYSVSANCELYSWA